VTIIVCFNLLETYFALGRVEDGERIIGQLNKISLSNSEKKTKEAYEIALADTKKRIAANKI
jgi:hypothetical protein